MFLNRIHSELSCWEKSDDHHFGLAAFTDFITSRKVFSEGSLKIELISSKLMFHVSFAALFQKNRPKTAQTLL